MNHDRMIKSVSFLVVSMLLLLALAVIPGEGGDLKGVVTGTRKMFLSTPGASIPQWDLDGDRVSDILENELSSRENTNALLLFDRDIDEEDRSYIEGLGLDVTSFLSGLDIIEVRGLTWQKTRVLLRYPGLGSMWHRGTMVMYGDVQSANVKARESEEYSPYTAWELGYRGQGVNIAIMDTGIDNAHPSLAGKWVGGADMSKPETFLTPRDGSYDADDTNGHGTTCSGISTGTGAPEGDYMGAAPEAKLVDLRIGTVVGYAPGEVYQDFYDASLQGAQWALDHRDDAWSGVDSENHGIDILSLSWGVDVGQPSDGKDPYSASLNKLIDAGVHVVVAAGNDGPNNNGFHGMGSADGVITVGATDDDDTINRSDDFIASYSSRGPRTDDGDNYGIDELKPDISASGTHIIQCQYSSNPLDDASGNGYGNRGSGTSYATPSVAGVMALMLEANPGLTPPLTKEILRATAERRGEASEPERDPFWNRDFGWGIIDAYKAVKMAEELNVIDGIDIELQCFITNFSFKGDRNIVSGVAWSRTGGKVDKVIVTGGDEPLAIDISDESPGQFVNWSLELSSKNGGPANITAYVTGGGRRSLDSTMNVMLTRKKGSGHSFGFGGAVTLMVSVAVVVVLGGTVIYVLRRRKKVKRDQ